ncbi:hypothetical protein [Streptomyces sp. NPDC000410]|uniref:hypothetical protein n=1 Tax=Streptomyces sp. NPDC000410 TaxID=3154254 RepID=UPI003325B13C
MSEITGTGTAVGHEAYAFACMRCGHGWEQSYDIEHHIDASGKELVVYKSDGVRVPSPLSHPVCTNCSHRVVRIMRAGQVSSVRDGMARMYGVAPETPTEVSAAAAPAAGPVAAATRSSGPVPGKEAEQSEQSELSESTQHHWHLSDLLHPFQHRK